jgi:hypothetical protein
LSSSEIDLVIVAFPPILSQISAEIHRQMCTRKGKHLRSIRMSSWHLGLLK